MVREITHTTELGTEVTHEQRLAVVLGAAVLSGLALLLPSQLYAGYWLPGAAFALVFSTCLVQLGLIGEIRISLFRILFGVGYLSIVMAMPFAITSGSTQATITLTTLFVFVSCINPVIADPGHEAETISSRPLRIGSQNAFVTITSLTVVGAAANALSLHVLNAWFDRVPPADVGFSGPMAYGSMVYAGILARGWLILLGKAAKIKGMLAMLAMGVGNGLLSSFVSVFFCMGHRT